MAERPAGRGQRNPEAAAHLALAPGQRGIDRRLVIVEDTPRFARALGRYFERRGYRFRLCGAFNGESRIFMTFSPQYAVIDLKLVSAGAGMR